MLAALPLIALLCLLVLQGHDAWLLKEAEGRLAERAALLAASPLLFRPEPDTLGRSVQEWALLSGARVTLISDEGTVLAESMRPAEGMVSHGQRPEVERAIAEGYAALRRFSATAQEELLYVATLYETDAGASGVLRLAIPVARLRLEARSFRVRVQWAAAGCAALAGLIALVGSQYVARPIRQTVAAAEEFSLSNLAPRLPQTSQDEVTRLNEQINRLTRTLQERLATIHDQAAESSAILGGMVEGVLAVDPNQRVLRINAAAADLLGTAASDCEGRSLQECLRHAELLAYVRDVLGGKTPGRKDVPMNGGTDLLLEVSGTALRSDSGEITGAVLVLNDVTRLRRLQRVRSEFVANVSHELKTPITAILGFAETLRDGAMEQPQEARRFLEIIERQAQRMYEMVDDLLQLSRLEESMARGEIARGETLLRPVVEAAIQQAAARGNGTPERIRVDCPETLSVEANAPLLEQALVNLLDNALKYSHPNSPVDLSARKEEQAVLIQVHDSGEGISQQHLPRVFERFYRVDKARTPQVGGTGLGLSIVKHIAQAHGGIVSAQSRLGQGSVFTLRLPSQ